MGRSQLAVLVVCVASLACGGSSPSEPILAADQALIVTADEVLGVGAIDRTKEVWSKSRAFDGAVELTYEYEADAFFLNCSANHEVDADSASWVYSGANIGLDVVGSAMGNDVQFVDAPGVLTWGDERNCRSVQTQGLNVGVMCVARKGRLVYTFMLTGQTFSDAGSLDVFLADELAALESWHP